MRKLTPMALAIAAATAFAVVPAQATFRGSAGLLAYQAQVGEHIQLFTVRPDGNGSRQLTDGADSDSINASWSPDGRAIEFVRHWTKPRDRTITYLMNADGSGLRALDRRLRGDLSFAWFPDGKHALMIRALKFVVVDLRTGAAHEAGVPSLGSSCVLPDGKRVVLKVDRNGGAQSAVLVGRIGGGRGSLERLSPWQSMTDKIDCSPDGTRIVFSAPATESSQSTNVYSVGVDGTGLRQLTHSRNGVDNGVDSWSPDGKKIAFASDRSGTYQIYSMNADGTGIKQVTHGSEAHLASWGSHP